MVRSWCRHSKNLGTSLPCLLTTTQKYFFTSRTESKCGHRLPSPCLCPVPSLVASTSEFGGPATVTSVGFPWGALLKHFFPCLEHHLFYFCLNNKHLIFFGLNTTPSGVLSLPPTLFAASAVCPIRTWTFLTRCSGICCLWSFSTTGL